MTYTVRPITDRTPKPCLHKVADHQHGTNICYVADGCRCTPCAEANHRYDAARSRQQAYGRWNGLVDADPARTHVRYLMEHGMGAERISAAAGVSSRTVATLLYGGARRDGSRRAPSRRLKPHVAAAVLAVPLDIAPGTRVEGHNTRRRLRALVAAGWSQGKLARHLGMTTANMCTLIHSEGTCLAGTAVTVHALYKTLVNVPPPEGTHHDKIAASRARSTAARHGWAPPLRIAGRPWIGQPYEVAS